MGKASVLMRVDLGRASRPSVTSAVSVRVYSVADGEGTVRTVRTSTVMPTRTPGRGRAFSPVSGPDSSVRLQPDAALSASTAVQCRRNQRHGQLSFGDSPLVRPEPRIADDPALPDGSGRQAAPCRSESRDDGRAQSMSGGWRAAEVDAAERRDLGAADCGRKAYRVLLGHSGEVGGCSVGRDRDGGSHTATCTGPPGRPARQRVGRATPTNAPVGLTYADGRRAVVVGALGSPGAAASVLVVNPGPHDRR